MNDGGSAAIDCHWRRSCGEESQATCGLLHKLCGLKEPDLCSVSEAACLQCMKWFPPSEEHLNPVVASFLYTLCSGIVQSSGIPGCTYDRAIQLRDYALASIPHDFDAVPVANVVDSQRNTQIADVSAIIPRPDRRYGAPVREWAVAVTTAPRKQSTLDHCLQSLQIAGWEAPRIIVDGEVAISPEWEHLPTTYRLPQIGAWPSWYLTLIELLMRQPNAQAFMIVQDDVVLFQHPGLRMYLESVLWPASTPGIVSLFCSRAYNQSKPGWYHLEKNLVWGGQALVFSHEAATNLVSDPEIVRHRFSGSDGLANIDGVVGKWAWENETPVHVTSPSLAQHIGHISAIWQAPRAFENRSSSNFAGLKPHEIQEY